MSNRGWNGQLLGRLIVAGAILWHLLSVLGPPRQPPPPNTEGRDFASYYYAAKVALAGGNPYDKSALEALASEEGTRTAVHPFFYPPPFLALVAWSAPLPLLKAYWLWFFACELALLAAVLSLHRWWRPFGPEVGPVLAVVVALMYGVAYSSELGQANFPVLLLVILGLAEERRRPILAGVAVGLACMSKMSPALIVVWWLLRRRRAAVLSAVATAIASSLLVAPLLSPATQLLFYRDVLPALGSGDYNGLEIRIEMFGNHSMPNLWHQYFPSDTNQLSPVARVLSLASTAALLAVLARAFRKPTEDALELAAQGSAVLVAMLLVPVYTYEHHLVFAIPAMVLAIVAVLRGWLGRGWGWVLALAIPVLLYDLPSLRLLTMRFVTTDHPALYFWLQESKMAALIAVGAAMVRLGSPLAADPSRAPAPLPAR